MIDYEKLWRIAEGGTQARRGTMTLMRPRLARKVGLPALFCRGGTGERTESVKKKEKGSGCEYCGNFVYDEEYGCYICDVELDEDEMSRFLSDSFYNCPYFQMNDEYRIVRKQM